MIYNLRFAKIFLDLVLFFLFFGWVILLFAAIGKFSSGTVAVSIAVGAIAAIISSKNVSSIKLLDSKFWLPVILISLIASFVTCYFASPTIFGGRDQGSIATAAIYLNKNHQLKFSTPLSQDLFEKYGPGRALNFPGFDYTKDGKLISRFPVAYTSYLAAAHNIFGLDGIQYANFIPLFLFFITFWLIMRNFFSETISFLGFLLAITFFPFLWFAKYTLTEIYTLFLVWTGIYFLIISFRDPTPKTKVLAISLAAFAISALARIEGIVFFLLAIIYIVLMAKKKIITLPKNFYKFLSISILFLLILYLFLNFPALADSAKNAAKTFLSEYSKESSPSSGLYLKLLTLFTTYNFLVYVILGLVGVFYLVFSVRKKLASPEFLIIFILFPSLIYLIAPLISLDDPWLFRRYVFAVFPMLIFFSVYVLNKFFLHKIFLYLTLAVLIAANGVVSYRFIAQHENKKLLPQIEEISKNFSSDDLILVDRMATDSGWSLMSEPLNTIYNRQAVYFFNAEDLKFIDQSRYQNIYLIAPFTEGKIWHKGLDKKPVKFITLSNNYFEPTQEKFRLAQEIESKIAIGIWKIKPNH